MFWIWVDIFAGSLLIIFASLLLYVIKSQITGIFAFSSIHDGDKLQQTE